MISKEDYQIKPSSLNVLLLTVNCKTFMSFYALKHVSNTNMVQQKVAVIKNATRNAILQQKVLIPNLEFYNKKLPFSNDKSQFS